MVPMTLTGINARTSLISAAAAAVEAVMAAAVTAAVENCVE